MNLLKYLSIISISILPYIDTIGQTKIVNKQLQIGVTAGYGHLNWTTKYSAKISHNAQSDYYRDTDLKNSGKASSIDLRVLYMFHKFGFGISLGRRSYMIDKLTTDLSPEFTMPIPDEHINLFGGLFNFEIFKANNFKIRPEIGVGIFSLTDKHINKAFDNKFFTASQVKLEYLIKNFNISIAPSYEFISSKNIFKSLDGTTFTYKNRADLIRISFGVAYIISIGKPTI